MCNIYHGKQKYLYLGDISAEIDWGYAKDYVETSLADNATKET